MTHHPGPWEFEPIMEKDRAPMVIPWLFAAFVSTALFIGACMAWLL